MGDVGQQLLKQRQDGELTRSVVIELVEREKAMRRIITTRAESTDKAEKLVTALRTAHGAMITNKPLVAVIEGLIEKVAELKARGKTTTKAGGAVLSDKELKAALLKLADQDGFIKRLVKPDVVALEGLDSRASRSASPSSVTDTLATSTPFSPFRRSARERCAVQREWISRRSGAMFGCER